MDCAAVLAYYFTLGKCYGLDMTTATHQLCRRLETR